MKWMLILGLFLAFSVQATVLTHPTCKLKFFEHKLVDDIEAWMLEKFDLNLQLDKKLEANGFFLERRNGQGLGAVKLVRDVMKQEQLIGLLNVRIRGNDISFWDEVKGKKKKTEFVVLKYRIEQLVDAEYALFDQLDEIVIGGKTVEGAWQELLDKLPRCVVEKPEAPAVQATPQVDSTPVPPVEQEANTGQNSVIVDEPSCRCYPGESSSTHLCHNRGVADSAQFYFIHCKGGKPVYDPSNPSRWLITNKTSCEVHEDCCNSFKYNEPISWLGKSTRQYCTTLAQTFGE